METDPPLLDRAADLLLRHRAAAIATLVLLTLGFGLAASHLAFSTSPESLLQNVGADLTALRSHEAALGGFEHTALLVLTPGDAFDPAVLDRIAAAGEALRARADVRAVRSLVESGFPLPDPAVDPTGFRRAVLANPLLSPMLVSRDGTTTAIQVTLRPAADTGATRAATLVGVLGDAKAAGLAPRLAGVPAVRLAYADYIRDDLLLLPPMVGLLLAVLLFAAFRRVLPVLALLATVAVVTVWTVGILSLAGGHVTALTAILPSLIVVVGIATGVHVVAQFREERDRGAPAREAARRAMARMALPCFLTALTTAVGFSSLVVAGIRDVREFGLVSALGALLSFVVGLPATGLALSFLGGGRPRRAGLPLDRPLRALARLLLRRPGVAIGVGALLALVATSGFPLIQTDTFMLEDIRGGEPIREATEIVDRELGGVIGFDLVLRSDAGLLRPEALVRIEALETGLRALPGCRTVTGPGTLVAEAAKVAGLDPAAAAPLVLAAIRARGGSAAARSLISDDHRLARIAVRTGDVGSARSAETRQAALALARARLGHEVEVSVGGLTVVAEIVLDRLVTEMGKSTLLAFVVIFLLLALLFRSLPFGLLAMVPNLLPLLVAAGFIGWAGITVRSSIALIFAVALGIAVDDTIHFLVRYRRERARGRSGRTAVGLTIRRTGRPIVLTSVVLFLGFLMFLVSGFRATEDFGIVAAVTIASALVGDLLLLPGLLLVGARRRRLKGSG